MSQLKEYFLTINAFDEPAYVTDEKAIETLLIRLMIMDKGTSDINPEMGVGLWSEWRYCEADKLPDLEAEILNQINTYLPRFMGSKVNITQNPEEPTMAIIQIDLNTKMYRFKSDSSNKTIKIIDII